MAKFKRTPPDFTAALLPPPPDDFVPQFSKVRPMQAPGADRRCSTLLAPQPYATGSKKLRLRSLLWHAAAAFDQGCGPETILRHRWFDMAPVEALG